jgi:uncharacterized membrane protein YccC
MCQPHLGASLRKGWFRMIGTLAGAVAIVVLTTCFPQDRASFLIGLALWGAACALVATVLRNFASYAAALAGYTAAIIASDQLGATGGLNGEAFAHAISRVSEIWIGIVCAGIVLAGTDFGAAPRRLAALFATLSAEIASGFGSLLVGAGLGSSASVSVGCALIGQQPMRRELIRQVIALDPAVDAAIGESSVLRFHSPVLQAAIEGLFAALAAWRAAALQLTLLPDAVSRQEADTVWRNVPEELRISPQHGEPSHWIANPAGMRRFCDAAIRTLTAMPAGTPSLRLVADQTARVLAGLSNALDGLALLAADPARRRLRAHSAKPHVPDWLPPLVNAVRAFVAIGAAEVFWILTAWPNGASAITWTALAVLLFSPRAAEAYTGAVGFVVGTGLATFGAAAVLFAVLPNLESFAGFSLGIGLWLIPAGALMAQFSQTAIFASMAGNFIPLLAPANQMSYDIAQFYNSALAIIGGCGAAALSFRLLPPLSPTFQTRRLLELTLRDLRRLAVTSIRPAVNDWRHRMCRRLAAVPNSAAPSQLTLLLTALSVGTEIIHLRRLPAQLGLGSELDSAFKAFVKGDIAGAIEQLNGLDHRLASLADSHALTSVVLRERGRILVICDALVEHRAYFDKGAPA